MRTKQSKITGLGNAPSESVADFKLRLRAMIPKVPRNAEERPCVRTPTDKGFYPPTREKPPTGASWKQIRLEELQDWYERACEQRETFRNALDRIAGGEFANDVSLADQVMALREVARQAIIDAKDNRTDRDSERAFDGEDAEDWQRQSEQQGSN